MRDKWQYPEYLRDGTSRKQSVDDAVELPTSLQQTFENLIAIVLPHPAPPRENDRQVVGVTIQPILAL